MPELILLVLLFFITPAVTGQIINVLASAKKRAWYMQVTQWKALECSVALFAGLLGILILVTTVNQLTGWKPTRQIGVMLLIATCVSAATYLWHFWGLSSKAANHKRVLTAVAGVLTLTIATASKISSDMAIAEFTNLSPQELPGAQLLLTFILTPVLWMLTLSLALGYASIPLTLIILGKGIYADWKTNKGAKPTTSTGLYVSAVLALCYFTAIQLVMISNMLTIDVYEKPLRTAVAHAAFLLPPSYCGLPDIEGAGIAVLKYRRAGLAIPHKEKGYEFSTISCDPKPQTIEAAASKLAAHKASIASSPPSVSQSNTIAQ
jgi:hypothetical protein